LFAALASTALAAARDPFPDPRPATRAAALALVAGESPGTLGCLTPRIEGWAGSRIGTDPAVRRALALLRHRSYSGVERSVAAADGTTISFTVEPSAFDRISPADADGDGTPDLVQRVVEGLDGARTLLVERLRLPAPVSLRVMLLELGAGPEGYLVADQSGMTAVLDVSPAGGGDAMRHAAAHQYAHAVARSSGPALAREWAEALATWTTLEVGGMPDGIMAGLLSARLERLDEGLLARDLELAAGNAIWFAFLYEAYGPAAVSLTVRELALGGPVDVALDRAIGHVSNDNLAAAFREFHLWSTLVGPRSDRFHFPFADRLSGPRFASSTRGLPALSVQADPAVAPWGATLVRVVPEVGDGGLGLRFEGEYDARWEVDLLLTDEEGVLRRMALDLAPEGSGEATVPLDGVAEALLLVRNLGSVDGAPHRYTYAAHRERGYPVEIASFEARPDGDDVELEWETASEHDVLAFNLLRVREDGRSEVVVNPVWIPAVGEPEAPTVYHFVDGGAEPGATYVYRVQAITTSGMTSLSEPVIVRLPASP
jgi:hypothetical protein